MNPDTVKVELEKLDSSTPLEFNRRPEFMQYVRRNSYCPNDLLKLIFLVCFQFM